MGFVSDMVNKPGAGVDKNAPEKTGFARFWEILSRDFIDFIRLNLFVALLSIPFSICVGFYFLADVKPLILLPIAWLLFLPIGSGIVATYGVILKRIRNMPCFVWHEFKKSYKENFVQSTICTAIFSLIFAVLGWAIYSGIFYTDKINFVLMVSLLLALVTITAVSNYMFAQIAIIQLPLGTMLKNAALLAIGRANRTMPAVVIEIAIYCLVILFMPYTLMPLLVCIISLVAFITLFFIWPALQLICGGMENAVDSIVQNVDIEVDPAE